MFTTVEGSYDGGKVELDETPAGIGRSRVLVTFLDESPHRGGVDLYGAWKGRVPHDLDIDSLLREVRSEWAQNGDLIDG